MNASEGLWAHLTGGALFWLTLTLVVYTIVDRLSLLARRNPLANPVLHSVWVIGTILVASGTPYEPISTVPISSIFCSDRPPSRSPCRSTRTGASSCAPWCRSSPRSPSDRQPPSVR